MNTLLITTIIAMLLSAFWFFKKPKTKRLERIITIIHFTFLGLSVLTLSFLFHGLRFIGQYTNSIIGLVFLLSGILLFGVTRSQIVKVYSGFIAIPTFLTEVSLLFGGSVLILPGLIAYLMFAAPLKKEKVNGQYNLEIHQGAFLAPPNQFYLTKRTDLIFDKQISLVSHEHLADISKLEVMSFTENEHVVCKIYSTDTKNGFSVDTLRYQK